MNEYDCIQIVDVMHVKKSMSAFHKAAHKHQCAPVKLRIALHHAACRTLAAAHKGCLNDSTYRSAVSRLSLDDECSNLRLCRRKGVTSLEEMLRHQRAEARRPANLQTSDKEFQHHCYLGNCLPLLQHLRSKRYNTYMRGSVRTYFEKNPGHFPLHRYGLTLAEFEVDHILPDSFGGLNHPYNYFLISKQGGLNQHLSHYFSHEKAALVGKATISKVKFFMRWVRAGISAQLNLSDYQM